MNIEKKNYDINFIKKILQHRYPFLLLDRLIEIDAMKSCIGLKQVTINEPFFQGHFPKYPVMPGVLQIEAMAQNTCICCLSGGAEQQLKNFQDGDGQFFFAIVKIEKAFFRKKIVPGDTLIIHSEILNYKRKFCTAESKIFVRDLDGKETLASEASLGFTTVNIDS